MQEQGIINPTTHNVKQYLNVNTGLLVKISTIKICEGKKRLVGVKPDYFGKSKPFKMTQ